MRMKSDTCVADISFKFGKGNIRLIVHADVYLPKVDDVLLSVDSDDPSTVTDLTFSTGPELWKLRLASRVGYGPCSDGKPGLFKPMEPPNLMIAGMEIEMTTHTRMGSMPLLHDDKISITISNGAWYDKTGSDVCVCIYTFGYVAERFFEGGRKPVFLKANSPSHAVELAYVTFDKLGYDFINVHNAFNFDIKHMTATAKTTDSNSHLFEEKRLDNFEAGMTTKLTDGCMILDTLYTAMKTSRPGK